MWHAPVLDSKHLPSRLVILLNIDVLPSSGLEKIGDPQNIDNSAGSGAAAGSEGARQQAAPAAAHAPVHTPAPAPSGAAKPQSAPYSSNQ